MVPPCAGERISLGARLLLLFRTAFVRDLGRAGERAAEYFVRSRGLHAVERNWRDRDGELDLIAVTPGNVLVFVEVKTTLGAPVHAWNRIDAAKRDRCLAAAADYLRSAGLASSVPQRFDVILVTGDPRSLRSRLRFRWAQGVF